MMEVDTHSPSPRMTRSFNYSLKRPRSPGSPSQERQPKRSSLALQDTYPSRRASSSVFSANQSSSNHHQPSPDDWVRQASDLSIGRPLSVDPLPSPSGDVQDESMALDLDEPPKTNPTVHVFSLPRLQQPSRAHSPTTQLNASQAYINSQHPSQIIAGPADGRPLTPSITMTHQQPPSIYTQPCTSSDGSSNQQELQSEPPQNHDFLQTTSSGMPISSPPSTSQIPGTISSSGRKQRFTMGPRADCLKCRMGVKGHWVHFD
ncbi:hypothetical protein DEU56DRAFT_764408 [Suillus clintonianus]|uniref:uncharacterized protein n=1 Tax=Suillus clintonianus TaxID=1904413 RepID=UPI001B8864E5|nr:uncharacterized protein DEU56DRAFT_764408 [Suillus clintonianus]KAG2157393.1 hypothetical protein DEU56DRAFT_764408 [Suillus clintonianus]